MTRTANPAEISVTLIRGEDTPEFQQHLQTYYATLRPASESERVLVHTMATATWRARNCTAAERELLARRIRQRRAEDPARERKLSAQSRISFALLEELENPLLPLIHRWQDRQGRTYRRAMAALTELRAQRG